MQITVFHKKIIFIDKYIVFSSKRCNFATTFNVKH